MPGHYLRHGYTNIQNMVADIVTDLKAAGFVLREAYGLASDGTPVFSGNTAPNHSATTGYYVLSPSKTVDPLALETGDEADPLYQVRQPWRIVIHVCDTPDAGTSNPTAKNYDFIRIWVCTSTQVIKDLSGEVSVASYATRRQSGYLYDSNLVADDTDKYTAFFSRTHANIVNNKPWSCFTAGSDQAAIPLAYSLSVTDHGVMLSTWAENFDSSGNCFNWFCVQRLVDDAGDAVVDQKSPLVCVFSQNGGGAADSDTLVPLGIQYFIVSEEDVNAPTVPQSAVQVTPDSFPFINPIQQVGVMTNRNYIMHFPKGINTQRHYYPYKLDMLAYASADVISHKSQQTITMFDEQRKLRALNANSQNNRGMRILMLVEGSGIN